MRPENDLNERLIWSTRGRSWGFRFLLNGGLPDPLEKFERSFAGLGDAPAVRHRIAEGVALRLPDPLGRRDASGRVIPHEFLLFGDLADEVESVDDGLRRVWPLVSEVYARVWDAERPPSMSDLRFAAADSAPRDVPGSPNDGE